MLVQSQTQWLVAAGTLTGWISVTNATGIIAGSLGTLYDDNSGPISVKVETVDTNSSPNRVLLSRNGNYPDLTGYTPAGAARLFLPRQRVEPIRTISVVPGMASVIAYGAVGDGVTDDTEAIQACITDNPGGTIFFPPTSGSYLISGQITVPTGTSIVGSGWKSKITRTGDTTDFFAITEGCSVRDVWLAHTGDTVPVAGAAILYIHPVTLVPPWRGGARVEHVKITDCFFGFYIAGSPPPSPTAVQFTATACIIEQIHEAGVYMNSVADAHLSDFWIDGQPADGSANYRGTGIWLDYWCQGITFQGMEVIACDHALRCTGVMAPIAFNKFSSCFFDTCATGNVYLDYCGSLEFYNCWVAGVSSPTGYGYRMSRTSGVQIHGGTAFALPIGIQIDSTSQHISVIGKEFMGAIGTCVDVAAGVSNFRVQSCMFGNPAFGSNITNGVVIANGASDKYIVADNLFHGPAVTNPIVDGGTGLNKRVADNF